MTEITVTRNLSTCDPDVLHAAHNLSMLKTLLKGPPDQRLCYIPSPLSMLPIINPQDTVPTTPIDLSCKPITVEVDSSPATHVSSDTTADMKRACVELAGHDVCEHSNMVNLSVHAQSNAPDTETAQSSASDMETTLSPDTRNGSPSYTNTSPQYTMDNEQIIPSKSLYSIYMNKRKSVEETTPTAVEPCVTSVQKCSQSPGIMGRKRGRKTKKEKAMLLYESRSSPSTRSIFDCELLGYEFINSPMNSVMTVNMFCVKHSNGDVQLWFYLKGLLQYFFNKQTLSFEQKQAIPDCHCNTLETLKHIYAAHIQHVTFPFDWVSKDVFVNECGLYLLFQFCQVQAASYNSVLAHNMHVIENGVAPVVSSTHKVPIWTPSTMLLIHSFMHIIMDCVVPQIRRGNFYGIKCIGGRSARDVQMRMEQRLHNGTEYNTRCSSGVIRGGCIYVVATASMKNLNIYRINWTMSLNTAMLVMNENSHEPYSIEEILYASRETWKREEVVSLFQAYHMHSDFYNVTMDKWKQILNPLKSKLRGTSGTY